MAPKHPTPRPGTLGDRDRYEDKHSRTSPHGLPVAVPVEVTDEDSQAIEDPVVRAAIREDRSTPERFRRIEKRNDELTKKLLGILDARETVAMAREAEAARIRRKLWRLFFHIVTPLLSAAAMYFAHRMGWLP